MKPDDHSDRQHATSATVRRSRWWALAGLAIAVAFVVSVVGSTRSSSLPRAPSGSMSGMTTPSGTPSPHPMAGMQMQGMTPLVAGADGTTASAAGLTLKAATTRLPTRRDTSWTLNILDVHGSPVTRFERDQTKLMHLIVVREDFTGYQHLHPVLRAGGRFTTAIALPRPGRYHAIADFTTAGKRYALGVVLTAAGSATTARLPPARSIATADGYTVGLTHGALKAGAESRLTFTVRRAGRPVTALEPYLGAYGHLVALRNPDLAYSHVHPTAHDSIRATVTFAADFATAATYRLFMQFRAGRRVHTASFTLSATR